MENTQIIYKGKWSGFLFPVVSKIKNNGKRKVVFSSEYLFINDDFELRSLVIKNKKMNQYKADLHIHTLLSPCGDLEMSPAAIVQRAADLSIDILGITDHNSTRHAPLIAKLAKEQGIFTLCGAEVTTREEAHCLAFFSDFEKLDDFQKYLDDHLPNIKNDTNIFGYQVVIDEQEMIVDEIEKLLISAIDQSIDQITKKVRELGGMFIPAHIDRPKFSLTSQLGFVPPGMDADALEVSVHSSSQKICNDFP